MRLECPVGLAAGEAGPRSGGPSLLAHTDPRLRRTPGSEIAFLGGGGLVVLCLFVPKTRIGIRRLLNGEQQTAQG